MVLYHINNGILGWTWVGKWHALRVIDQITVEHITRAEQGGDVAQLLEAPYREHGMVLGPHGLRGPDLLDSVTSSILQRSGYRYAQGQIERRLLVGYTSNHARGLNA